MDSLVGRTLLGKDGTLKSVDDAFDKKVKTILYYFTASYVHEQKHIAYALQNVYNESKLRNIGWEVIYVTSDTKETEFMKDFQSETHGNCELRYKYNITNLPNIVVVRLNGDIVTTNGRVELEAIGMNVLVTWDI
ncbi:nucleoredoxin-like protein 2 isoform X2 [Aethina tumida]|uniref:nucleoredoxin-like protein 2 isoform X2 n=1 Tax=Aethina tumida TaxID=116153 RepID=UPI002147E1F1|nr:nucleoredoxin-like protein 2 isoform X2 [Aethina tumida]